MASRLKARKMDATTRKALLTAPASVGLSHGRIARSPEARQEFMTQTGYPHGWPGYVVDHIIPLKRGGADEP
jgi:hypothetical protein